MRNFIITKNALTDLNVFFYKEGLNNIHRPHLSMLKVDSSSKAEPIFHIGFERNMGFIDSIKINAGAMVFEVLEGYPLQSLLFFHNSKRGCSESLKYDLTDLEPLDFYCLQNKGEDPYGDFVIKNVKFISTRMEQSVNNPSRQLIAEFVCTEIKSFKLRFFFNDFKSDNYDYHIIRNKEEIEQIKSDIRKSSNIPGYVMTDCSTALGIKVPTTSTDVLCDAIDTKYSDFLKIYLRSGQKHKIPQMEPIREIMFFIYHFYKWRNKENEKKVRETTQLDFLTFRGER